MKYMTIIFFIAIATYNLQDSDANYVSVKFLGSEVYIWRFVYHFFFDLTLAFAFYELYRKAVLKYERKIYLGGFLFMVFCTAFNIATLGSKSLNIYLAQTNSLIWGAASGILILFILITLIYDKERS